MLKAFFKGGADVYHETADTRLIVFTRGDDAPLPYAEVTEAEARRLDRALFDVPGVEPKPERPKGAKPKKEGK